jgi:hypothetical protein
MSEREMRLYLEKYNEEFIKRYILKCISHELTCCKVDYLGSEIKTGIGLHRADMVYIVKTLYPIIVVIELKQEISTDAIIQLQNYIKEFKKSKILEKNRDKYFHANFRYVGIVVGKWIRPIVSRLIESNLSNDLSYIEFFNNEYKCMDEDKTYYYTDETYWFENKIFVK